MTSPLPRSVLHEARRRRRRDPSPIALALSVLVLLLAAALGAAVLLTSVLWWLQ